MNASFLRKISVSIVASLLAHSIAVATPYASGITNNAGSVSFVLNESADNVMVRLNPGGTTLDLGARSRGTHSFSLGAATSFQIVVSKTAAAGWALISSDTNALLQFNTPRGVAVNLNTNSPTFGRIYVANSAVGTAGTRSLGEGIYLLNADQSDALGRSNTASTAGIAFDTLNGTGTPGANSPWHIEVGPDNFLYIADFSVTTANLYRTDLDVSPGSGTNILAGIGTNNFAVHTTIGSSPIVRGSLAASNLTVWAIDGRFPGTANQNRLFRWDINGGPLPYNTAPTPLATPLINNVADVTTDLARGPDGKFYLMQNRSAGNESGIVVTDDTGTNILWRSLTESRSISNNPAAVDILRISRAVSISPDGSKMAIIRDDLQTWVIPLINGIPDLTNREQVITYSGAPTTLGRDVCWDVAGNLYALSSGNQLLRIFSPGGATTATTSSDGTFNLAIVSLPTVSVTATNDAFESGPASANFNLARTGDASSPLTVNFELTGTASNGVDYVTVPTSATFLAGSSTATVTITPIDDSIPEFTESAVLTLVAGTNYLPIAPLTATNNIVDNEYPNQLTVTALDTNSFERFSSDVFTYRITRQGRTNIEAFVNVTLTGTATEGLDFSSLTNDIILPAGVVNLDVSFLPISDSQAEGDESVVLTLIPQPDYTVGVPGTATIRIRDDELSSAPVLFADNFESDMPGNWIVRFGANNGIYDATNIFAYDYVAAGIPLAPRSAPGAGRGLFLAVNKNDATALGSAGINLYPTNQTFAGDFALRFDMYLSFGTAGTTEHAIAGLNHSTLRTNRATQSVDVNNTTAGGDGVWVAIETDGSANRDYTAYTTTNQTNTPVIIASQTATTMTPFIPSPPYAFPGSPGVSPTSAKEWSTVELIQLANVITLKVNAATVFTFTNTTGFTSGDVMIGMNDQFDSVGSAANFVIFDNVEVVRLRSGSGINISGVSFPSPTTVAIDFTSAAGGTPADFHLQSASSLSSTPVGWGDDNTATIIATANGFRATTTRSGNERYYRIRR